MPALRRFLSFIKNTSYSLIIDRASTAGNIIDSGLVEQAHDAGLAVHPYTFRADPGLVPEYAEDFEQLLELFYFDTGVDGLFTDFPDRAVRYLQSR